MVPIPAPSPSPSPTPSPTPSTTRPKTPRALTTPTLTAKMGQSESTTNVSSASKPETPQDLKLVQTSKISTLSKPIQPNTVSTVSDTLRTTMDSTVSKQILTTVVTAVSTDTKPIQTAVVSTVSKPIETTTIPAVLEPIETTIVSTVSKPIETTIVKTDLKPIQETTVSTDSTPIQTTKNSTELKQKDAPTTETLPILPQATTAKNSLAPPSKTASVPVKGSVTPPTMSLAAQVTKDPTLSKTKEPPEPLRKAPSTPNKKSLTMSMRRSPSPSIRKIPSVVVEKAHPDSTNKTPQGPSPTVSPSPSPTPKAPSPPPGAQGPAPSKTERRMSHFKDYKFFRSFSAKVENWPMRKAEQFWRKMRERKLAEIESLEACKWLRAAGFPQYAQMFEDLQFPIDISGVQNDHPFLDEDSLQSLYRRLKILNRCAAMKIEHHSKRSNDSDDEQCALSEKWQYERKERRWSRVVEITPQAQRRLQVIAARALAERQAREARGEVEDDEDDTLPTIRVGLVDADGHYTDVEPDLLTVPGGPPPIIQLPSDKEDDDDTSGTRFRRTGSERLRDGAKALLRRVESLKTRRRKRQNRTEVIVSSPHFLDVQNDKYPELNFIDMTPTTPTAFPFPDFNGSPIHAPAIRTQPPSPITALPPSPIAPIEPSAFSLNPPFGDDSSSYASDGSMGSSNKSTKSKLGRAKRMFHRSLRGAEDSSALSDSECQPASWRHNYFKEYKEPKPVTTEVYVEPPSPEELKPDPAILREVQKSPGHTPHRRQAIRTSSLNLGKDGAKFRDKSLKRDKSASRSSELESSPNSTGSRSHDGDHDDDDDTLDKSKKNSIQRWYSFRTSPMNGGPKANNTLQPMTSSLKDPETCPSRPLSSMSCGQLHILKKLALLRLTACMERYCPSHKSGWNWELPKLIRKIKTPDYKDKTVFGVPLTVSLQRTGHSLPKPIQCALNWLKKNALEQMGIFRKAGVKSRIAKLRVMVEAAGAANAPFAIENMNTTEPQQSSLSFDGAQAHDVADLVKQYFRELPDVLLTNKLSDTFIAIFQHVPEHMRADAVQCALLLLPEEHLEALHSLLIFLSNVAEKASINQMTASNLAVCLAPTLLRLHHVPPQTGSTKEGNSNRIVPDNVADQRQISESRAAHACLLLLIEEYETLFLAPADMLTRCKFNYFEESVPVALEELGADFNQDWKGFQQACIKALLKEAKEKSRGWMSVSGAAPHVELCCKKVGDGHPLRLWRATTDVEAPPQEVMQRILRERHIWDDTLIKWRVAEKLGPTAEVFQYITASICNLPPRDYCVLRSWQQGGGGGGWCAVAETSVAHGSPPTEGARGVVLASRYLAQPAGKGRSRLVHLARVDTMGRTPEWYNKCYGHICALYLARIRASFKHSTEGPESNV